MDLFVLKSLERLRACAGFFESDLKEACDTTARAVNEAILASGTAADGGPPRASALDDDADKYFRPFAVAAEPRRTSRVKVVALDAIEKLIGAPAPRERATRPPLPRLAAPCRCAR